MGHIGILVFLFGIVVAIAQCFRTSIFPIAFPLVITGMVLGFFPGMPDINLNPEVVLNIFLPLLIYQISSFASWKEFRRNIRPIALLSIGHVIFITILVALVIHTLIPKVGWPWAFVLGAVISPPDDVAIVAIAEKIRMPEKIFNILEGEGMFNDAAALILFRFALTAVVANQFSVGQAFLTFLMILICETIYGLALGFIISQIRLRITNTTTHLLASILTPFLAYLPATALGGSGILATAITGFVVGNYSLRFTPAFRLASHAIWPTLSFAIQNIIFLLVGLNMHSIVQRMSSVPLSALIMYALSIILTVIVGRFFWVYVAVAFLPRALFPAIRKKDPYPPWQYPFIVSWAGMRGGISLVAALSVPFLSVMVNDINLRDLLIFLVFSVIVATLIVQGMTLPWLLKKLGINEHGKNEKYNAHLSELRVRIKMTKAVIHWLSQYKEAARDNEELLREIKLQRQKYQMTLKTLKTNIAKHDPKFKEIDENLEEKEESYLLAQLIDIEKSELLKSWHDDEINLATRDRLLERLDHQVQHLSK